MVRQLERRHGVPLHDLRDDRRGPLDVLVPDQAVGDEADPARVAFQRADAAAASRPTSSAGAIRYR